MRDIYDKARKIAKIISAHENILVVGHIDADGISSAAIAATSLERLGKDYNVIFVKQLDEYSIENIKNMNPELIWFVDVGSGQIELLDGLNYVITDHHIPSLSSLRVKDILDFVGRANKVLERQLNPHMFGLDGATHMSGSVATYIVSRELGNNKDLVMLAVVGAVGDLQDFEYNKLIGLNRVALQEGISEGYLRSIIDIRLFGRESRPIHKMLEYSSECVLPFLTGDEDACIEFLIDLGIELKNDRGWRRWIDLSEIEKKKIVNKLAVSLLRMGYGHNYVKKIIGEVYILCRETEGSYLHDAKEYSTLLNACGRHGKYYVGLEVCMGDRENSYKEAIKMINYHRRKIAEALKYLRELGVSRFGTIQYFDAEEKIDETIVGIVTNIALSMPYIDRTYPLLGLVKSSQMGRIKASIRTTWENVKRGLNLGEIIREAASACGGIGGGHRIAAGATIPSSAKYTFIELLESKVRNKLLLRGA